MRKGQRTLAPGALGLGLLLIWALAWVAPAVARADDEEEEIPLARVPAAARAAADKAVTGAKWTKALKIVEDGKTFFELQGTDAKGREVEVEATAKGEVLEVETTIPMSEVPKAVLNALQSKAKGVKTSKVAVVTKDGTIVSYSFEGQNAKGQDVEVAISPDGRDVEIEVED